LSDCCRATIDGIERCEPDGQTIFGISREKLRGLSKRKLREVLEDKLYKSTMIDPGFVVSPGFSGAEKLLEAADEEQKKHDQSPFPITMTIDYSIPRKKWSKQKFERASARRINVVDAISTQLDQQIKKFLIELIIIWSRSPNMDDALAKDDKFMKAAQPLLEDFHTCYNNLVNRR
jgi:hypothetical protein